MSFRFRPLLSAATLAAFAVLCSLGVWQVQRLAWKNDLIAQTKARLSAAPMPLADALARSVAGENLDYQPVFASGAFRHDMAANVFGTYDGKAGVFVFTPLDLSGPDGQGGVIYVNRGFAPQQFADPSARAGGLVAGPVRVSGLLRRAEVKRGMEKSLAPKNQPKDNLYFVRDPRTLAAAHRLDVPAFYVDSFGRETTADWPKGGLTRVEFPNRHLEYALTWFGLAGALVGVFLAFSLRRD